MDVRTAINIKPAALYVRSTKSDLNKVAKNALVTTKSDPDKVARCKNIKREGTTETRWVPISQVAFFMTLF